MKKIINWLRDNLDIDLYEYYGIKYKFTRRI